MAEAVRRGRRVGVLIIDLEAQYQATVDNMRACVELYRDHIDLAKMAQLLPVIGAPVGLIANYSLIKKLGNTAMNAYRMRLLQKEHLVN